MDRRRGAPWELLRLAEQGTVTFCTTPEIPSELADVLSYERILQRVDQLGLTPVELVGYAMNLASLFEVAVGDPIVLADPDDDIFVWCAQAADAEYIVSGDHHLLDLESFAENPIVTVNEFLEREVHWAST